MRTLSETSLSVSRRRFQRESCVPSNVKCAEIFSPDFKRELTVLACQNFLSMHLCDRQPFGSATAARIAGEANFLGQVASAMPTAEPLWDQLGAVELVLGRYISSARNYILAH